MEEDTDSEHQIILFPNFPEINKYQKERLFSQQQVFTSLQKKINARNKEILTITQKYHD
jgi:hypothetical protein